jgi:signal transduction histidine kinase
MTVELLDDGVGLSPSPKRIGTGLRNTRERLAHPTAMRRISR